ncbi:MAG TPA: gpW family head-tail joining protein [Burkholderiales bacterium]|nr:gpW family head-tail joining protein [Burkholderiales bacterium]
MTPNGRLPFQPKPMAANVRFKLPKVTDPATAATMLEQAQQAMFNLVTGQLPSGVETPQLGRVTFNATNTADLQRLIDYLSGVVASGDGSGNTNRRIPISFLAWP